MNQINANCEDEIKERFESLSLKIKEEIDLKKLSLTPIKLSIRIPYYGSENKDKNLGVTHPLTINTIEKDYYNFPADIYELVKNTEEYRFIAQGINFNDFPLFLSEEHIKKFIFHIGEKLINTSDSNESIIDDTIRIFINDLYDRPIKAKTTIKLSGVYGSNFQVNLYSECAKIILRSVEKNDALEKVNNRYINIFGSDVDYFSSIVEIEHNDSIFAEVNKMVALIRLYAIASVDYRYYETKEETVIKRDGNQARTEVHINSIEINPWVKDRQFNLPVTDENCSELVTHYHRLYKYIPQYIYDKPKTSINIYHPSLEVAYRHYSDALVRRIDEEEIILNAVIGLESLLIDENSENTVRFWLRGAKILSFFKYSPLAIKAILSSAYDARSNFVHGNSKQLYKTLKNFDNTNQNQDRFVSLTNLLECLRVLLILNIFLITKGEFVKNDNKFDKTAFLKLVDDSLIDKKIDEKLNNILGECHQTFEINLRLIFLREHE